MTTLFISDLHLSGERPRITQLFQDFLGGEARQAEALYILGDLFEVWLGDDAISPDIAPVLDDLARLTKTGIPLYVMVGNRDFLLGKGFAEKTGCTLLPDPTVIDLYGKQTLLMHGDTLCTDDIDYQQFREMVRNPSWQKDFLGKPIAERIRIGREARAESRVRTQEKPEQIMDTNAQAVDEAFRSHHVSQLIHGHTHRPAIHELDINGQTVKRIVLGDWYQQGSVLRVSATELKLSSLTRSTKNN